MLTVIKKIPKNCHSERSEESILRDFIQKHVDSSVASLHQNDNCAMILFKQNNIIIAE